MDYWIGRLAHRSARGTNANHRSGRRARPEIELMETRALLSTLSLQPNQIDCLIQYSDDSSSIKSLNGPGFIAAYAGNGYSEKGFFDFNSDQFSAIPAAANITSAVLTFDKVYGQQSVKDPFHFSTITVDGLPGHSKEFTNQPSGPWSSFGSSNFTGGQSLDSFQTDPAHSDSKQMGVYPVDVTSYVKSMLTSDPNYHLIGFRLDPSAGGDFGLEGGVTENGFDCIHLTVDYTMNEPPAAPPASPPAAPPASPPTIPTSPQDQTTPINSPAATDQSSQTSQSTDTGSGSLVGRAWNKYINSINQSIDDATKAYAQGDAVLGTLNALVAAGKIAGGGLVGGSVGALVSGAAAAGAATEGAVVAGEVVAAGAATEGAVVAGEGAIESAAAEENALINAERQATSSAPNVQRIDQIAQEAQQDVEALDQNAAEWKSDARDIRNQTESIPKNENEIVNQAKQNSVETNQTPASDPNAQKQVVNGSDLRSEAHDIQQQGLESSQQDNQIARDELQEAKELRQAVTKAEQGATNAERAGQTDLTANTEAQANEINRAYEAAKNGGKNSGMLKNYSTRSQAEIESGIASLRQQIADHEAKIADPEGAISNFKQLDPRQQQALVTKKWPSDIARQQDQLDVLQGLLDYLKGIK